MTAPLSNEEKVSTVARVTVTIEISLTQPWGSDCALDQVWKQARDQAVGIVERMRGNAGFRIVGDPQVVAVLIPEKAR